jgi:hypothetical protein
MKLYAFILALLAAARGGLASEVLVSQPTITGHVDTLNFGQSFTAPTSGNVSSIRLSVVGSFTGSEFTVRLHEFDRPSLAIDPVVLSIGIFPEASVPTTAAWIEIPMAPSAALVAGSTYAFTIQATDPGGVETGWNNYGAVFTDVYAGGEFFHGLSGTASLSNVRELGFEILVPEPGAAELLLAGTLAVGVLRSAKARRAFFLPSAFRRHACGWL